jgi:signal peptide peptidase SppA
MQRGSQQPPPAAAADPASSPATGPDDQRPRGYRIERGVAILPVHGVLAGRIGQVTPDSTLLQSYENLSRVLRSAHRDPRVRGILMDVDSPGGEADGVFDLADEIGAAAKTKPVWAIANHAALSAAYLLASAADRIWTTKTAALGSLGVVALHRDQSEQDTHEGLRYTYLYRGDRKIDANPHAPLTPEARASIQNVVDRVYGMLIDQVARQRRVEPHRLRDTDARVLHGDEAVGRGLADRVGTLDEAHAALVEHITPPSRGARSMTTEPAAESGDDNIVQLRVNDAVRAERERANTIMATCKRHGLSDFGATLIEEGVSVQVANERILERIAERGARDQVVAFDTSVRLPRRNLAAELEEAAQNRFAEQRRGFYRPLG